MKTYVIGLASAGALVGAGGLAMTAYSGKGLSSAQHKQAAMNACVPRALTLVMAMGQLKGLMEMPATDQSLEEQRKALNAAPLVAEGVDEKLSALITEVQSLSKEEQLKYDEKYNKIAVSILEPTEFYQTCAARVSDAMEKCIVKNDFDSDEFGTCANRRLEGLTAEISPYYQELAKYGGAAMGVGLESIRQAKDRSTASEPSGEE